MTKMGFATHKPQASSFEEVLAEGFCTTPCHVIISCGHEFGAQNLVSKEAKLIAVTFSVEHPLTYAAQGRTPLTPPLRSLEDYEGWSPSVKTITLFYTVLN